MTESWLQKPALQWSTIGLGGDNGVHWDERTLARLCIDTVGSSSISYQTLLPLTKNLSRRLHGTVVVAIPEGPFLPIAVMAVHMSTDAILVPMEPNEGIERLKHMVTDSKPSMVLCLPGSDWNKMHAIITQCGSDARLVDFFKLVDQSVDVHDDSDAIISGVAPLYDCNRSSLWEILGTRHSDEKSRISHIVFTSGTTGTPKGCISSVAALRHYMTVKNKAHCIDSESVVLLASALSFDPCLSDILATFQAKATLVIAPRSVLLRNMASVLVEQQVTHVLCTPTVWSMVPSPHCVDDDEIKSNFTSTLQVVALGGEPIPKRVVRAWADRVRLYATYGVTEACVYQTMGRVHCDSGNSTVCVRGQSVGLPFDGLGVRIVAQDDPSLEALPDGQLGEIVLSGLQIDHLSGYLNREDLTTARFINVDSVYHYKTGDQGHVNDGNLFITGRISSHDGMVKVNGIRVELGEIEAALVDDRLNPNEQSVVVDCLAVARHSDPLDEGSPKQLHAYCILSQKCLDELGIRWRDDSRGFLVSGGPILTLLLMLCSAHLRAGTFPSAFVIIPCIPLSPTGKADRRLLPTISECVSLDRLGEAIDKTLLRDYGNSGTMVADVISDILNLQPCQLSMLVTSASFSMLGGDSLAATRVVRTLYADHHKVQNTRFLGGSYGSLDGPFAVFNLLRSRNLGEYVDFLDSNGVGRPEETSSAYVCGFQTISDVSNHCRSVSLEVEHYECLMKAITIGQTSIAIGLLNAGVDSNACNHGGRLGKLSNRNDRKKLFTSNPLHVACAKGNHLVVRKLLRNGCKFNSPDASGNFPLHLVASGTGDIENEEDHVQDESNRIECVMLLLDAGVPISMKDGNRQTVLHAAARAGHSRMLRYVFKKWKLGLDDGKIKYHDTSHKGGTLDWMDKWYRTPVHWAVLNRRVDALEVLLQEGCSPNPPMPANKGASKGTSVHIESPLEICDRLKNNSDPLWARVRRLLVEF